MGVHVGRAEFHCHSAAEGVPAPRWRRYAEAASVQRGVLGCGSCGRRTRARNRARSRALLRREGLFVSRQLLLWRRQRDVGGASGASVEPSEGRSVEAGGQLGSRGFERELARLKRKLEQAETIIEIQKKVARDPGDPSCTDLRARRERLMAEYHRSAPRGRDGSGVPGPGALPRHGLPSGETRRRFKAKRARPSPATGPEIHARAPGRARHAALQALL